MKKYVKPELFYERYELTEQIADCAWDLNSADENTCGFVSDDKYSEMTGVPGGWVILSQPGICEIDYQNYCYQNGAEGMNTFNS